jgi:hypothetical protein
MEKQDMQRIIEMLAKKDADRKAWQEEMAAMRKEMDANQAKADAEWKAWRKRMDTSHKEIMAEIKPGGDMETMAYQDMEARQEEEPTSVDRKPEVTQQ